MRAHIIRHARDAPALRARGQNERERPSAVEARESTIAGDERKGLTGAVEEGGHDEDDDDGSSPR